MSETLKLINMMCEELAEIRSQADEIAKLKEKLEAVYDAGMWGIEHVAMANYAHRELEAKQKLREAAK